jgi:hypothetical protein
VANLGDSLGEIGGVIRTMLGLTRHSRVREQIRETAELYGETIKHEGLAESSADLAAVLKVHTKRLLDMAGTSKRSWNWSALIVSWLVAAGFGVAGWYLPPYWGTWWATPALVIVGLAGTLLVIAGVGVLVQRDADEA